MKLTKQDAKNLLDTLYEWNEHSDLGPKEMDEQDSGLDYERFVDLTKRLTNFIVGNRSNERN